MLYTCGTSIKLINTENNKIETFIPEHVNDANGICLLTANSAINKFALSETQLNPKVHIYDYLGLKQISQLEGCISAIFFYFDFKSMRFILK